MEWDRKADGELQLAVLQNVELAVAADQAVAIRIEFAEVQEQLKGAMAPSAKQFVLSPDAAERLGLEILEAAKLAKAAEGEA